MKRILVLALLSCAPWLHAAEGGWAFPCPTNEIAHYTALRVNHPIRVDGKLDEADWKAAPASPRFVDIITGDKTQHDTHAMVLWDDDHLYVAYRAEEPKLRAKYTKHNDPIYYDNDVEFFIAGRDAYYEFEINGYNTVYEVAFVWNDAYEKMGFAAKPDFARPLMVPFNGVGFTNHPRGGRLGNFQWEFPGRKNAVHLDGTVNDDSDVDKGWTVELALPWKSMNWLTTDGRALPPKDGDVWRMDFSRFNTYKAPEPAKDSGGWVWTRHGVWDSHIPECFAYIRFSTNAVAVPAKAP
jgi:hypothetical protein